MHSQIDIACPDCGHWATRYLSGDEHGGEEDIVCVYCDEADDARMAAAERGELAGEMDWAEVNR